MASVSVVSSADFRANLSQAQNPIPEGEEQFSLLLNSVANVKAGAQRPDAPRAAEKRADAPVKQQKPETSPDRQAKRQAKDTEKPDTKSQPESSAPIKSLAAGSNSDETVADGEDESAVDALLAVVMGEAEQPVTQLAGDTDVATQFVIAPVVNSSVDVEVEVALQSAPALAAVAAASVAAADGEIGGAPELQPVLAKQNGNALKAQFEISGEHGAEIEITLPKTGLEKISPQLKPLDVQSLLQPQAQVQPGSVNIGNATALQGPAHLEMLNAAINKHAQLSIGPDASQASPDPQKPLISSNAVAPNFAMTAQVNAPVQVLAQQSVETARAVPLEQLAVEITTRAGKGERRFDIRLDPPELGRIDVRLEIDSKGNTTTKLIVERAETLDMLQRDARGLEKALQNAGLKTDAGGMQFSLQQDTQAQHGHQSHAPEMRGRSDIVRADGEIMSEVSINSASLAAQLRGGVDIRI